LQHGERPVGAEPRSGQAPTCSSVAGWLRSPESRFRARAGAREPARSVQGRAPRGVPAVRHDLGRCGRVVRRAGNHEMRPRASLPTVRVAAAGGSASTRSIGAPPRACPPCPPTTQDVPLCRHPRVSPQATSRSRRCACGTLGP
jgi:hypothetical protein